ncbi:hypothetical protein BJX64DRAFT_282363 [Aspergillus heterothallicus]
MAGQPLSVDVWRLIFQEVENNELYDLCLVSKTFNSIATPLLYRSINLIAPELDPERMWRSRAKEDEKEQEIDKRLRGHWNLLSRLEDAPNETLRNYVQELDLSTKKGPRLIDQDFIVHLASWDRLCRVIRRLPNLRRVTLGIDKLQTDEMIDTINTHPRQPELILIIQDGGKKPLSKTPLPSVTNLTISVNPFDESKGENTRVLAVQDLLFACPNLRSLSLAVYWKYGGCVYRMPRYPATTSFRFTGTEVFPPIEELTLNGYKMHDGEWPHWRERFDWSELSSLTLGPQDTSGILGRFAGYATSLRTLKVWRYQGERSEGREDLTAFLASFESLRELEVKGFICDVGAIAGHTGLERLCLHEDESAREGKQRRVLSVEDLEVLDRGCPRLRTLMVDIKRGDGQLPMQVLAKLATGFSNLTSLSLHFELGLPDTKHPITPTLNYTSVRSIGQAFFDERRRSRIPIPSNYTLTIWTGNSYRRWPQWEPPYATFEKKYTATYEIRLSESTGSNGEVEVRHLQKESLDAYPKRGEGDVLSRPGYPHRSFS